MFRLAQVEDVARLRALAHESEKHWGYNAAFMEKFDRDFNISADFVRKHPVRILLEEAPVAFWGLHQAGAEWELEYFYVSAEKIGKGYGRSLWQDLLEWCAAKNVPSFGFVTSWQAVPFYEKMGAAVVGERKSAIDERTIPYLRFVL